MAYTKYSLTPANNTATPPDGAPEGMLPSAVNDTMRDMMAQIRDCGDGIRDGTYTMTAPKITGGTITGSTINNSAIGGTTANSGAFTTLSASGVATFSAGTVSAPALTTTGDTNTGIFFPAADTIAFAEGGAEAMRIDSSGNVGIGTSSPASRLDVANTFRAVNSTEVAPSSGKGIEIWYPSASDFGRVACYDRTGGAYKALYLDGSTLLLNSQSSGNVGIGTTSPVGKVDISGLNDTGGVAVLIRNTSDIGNTTPFIDLRFSQRSNGADGGRIRAGRDGIYSASGSTMDSFMAFYTAIDNADTERMRITSGGFVGIGNTNPNGTYTNAGITLSGLGYIIASASGETAIYANRKTNDGTVIAIAQGDAQEGDISVSGTTVSYNGGHLSRWAQMLTKPELLKGTVMSNLDEMNEYVDAEGNLVDNEQLNKVKVSDVEGDVNVAGVFVNWSHDEQHNVDEINMAMTGDMIIRIAQGVVVQKGDLLMSAGDGTAKPQGDDIVRSKTIAKVTSSHITCTYADGSYCVPCVLMAC